MTIQYQLYRVFSDLLTGKAGNTSPVFLLEKEISAENMQSIAADMWQPACTFIWQDNDHWKVRWFAPDQEISLCGHGSLAAIAHLNSQGYQKAHLIAGEHEVKGGSSGNDSCFIELAPIPTQQKITQNEFWEEALGVAVLEHYQTTNKNIILTDSESSVLNMKPNFEKLRASDIFGYAVTAAGSKVDFVSRTLVPHVHQLEDPATGSSHAALAPFWQKKLNKNQMIAYQLSQRGGKFMIDCTSESVKLIGEYQQYGSGEINLR